MPDYAHGKICYIEIPAEDIARSAAFYRGVFGWHLRERDDGSAAFDDGVNQVSGTWVTGRPPAREISLAVHIMVGDIRETLRRLVSEGGTIVQAPDYGSDTVYAYFRDPAGNVLGVYQEPALATRRPGSQSER